ncbi:MAG: HAMP domain-containing protein [Spirochaetales bacterium]|nr:HAMP domain-containing protein [Spirochaetales bacterium]
MFKLSNKILLSFTIIILSGSILMVSIINYSTRQGYKTFINENDLEFGTSLLPLMEQYYINNQNWDDLEDYLQLPKPRMGQMMERGRRAQINPPLIVTDKNGKIIVNNTVTMNPTWLEDFDKKIKNIGIKIEVNNNTVGYLLIGSMINFELTQTEQKFLNTVTYVIVFVSLFILFLSILFSYIFSKRLTKPINNLSIAAKNIGKGNYNYRLEITGNDEITELSKTFNQMTESLEQNDSWRKRIIADSAHELRTPVTLIQGNLELILEGVYSPNKENIEAIYNETVTLSNLIKELQQLSSAESNNLELNMEKIDIGLLLDSTVNSFKADFNKKDINSFISIPKNINSVRGDSQKLKQVFVNILSNAVRHTPENGSINTELIVNKNSIEIRISDTGTGIGKDELEKIFERFYRTDSSRNRDKGGSGLGLAISREIIRLHNGSIFAESDSQGGATFVINLPID